MRNLFIILLLYAGTLNASNTGGQEDSPVTYGEELPSWFFEGGCLGVSDPSSDTIIAYYQAVHRALAFYAIEKDAELASVYEYYYFNAIHHNDDFNNQRSHWIAEFETVADTLSYKVEKIFRTKYNETIVLLNIIDADENAVSVTAKGSFMYHYDSYNKAADYGEKQIMFTQTTDLIKEMLWNSTIDNNKYFKRSYIEEYYSDLKKTMNSYNDYGNTSDEMVFSKCEFGLWNAFVDSFFQALSMFESENIVIENSMRQITNEKDASYNDKSQNIARMVMKTNLSCSLVNLSLKNNCLYANWKIIER